MLIAGVDDAGRGPVIGPLVIAGILIDDNQSSVLQALGVKDSKVLTPNKRIHLFPQILGLAQKYAIVELSPSEVDKIVFEGKKLHRLNWLEAKAMAEVIGKLIPEVAYVDASDVVEERFGQQISELLPSQIKIVSEHQADANYPVVSAASIIAKVHRDKFVSNLRDVYGDFGSGYPCDPKTKQFLSNWIRDERPLPDFVRKSWKTFRLLDERNRQKRL
ncbi:MAG: ribonuclease [Thermoproteota archaeon]|nr:ribonuclease [Thermoproteota archaeon]